MARESTCDWTSAPASTYMFPFTAKPMARGKHVRLGGIYQGEVDAGWRACERKREVRERNIYSLNCTGIWGYDKAIQICEIHGPRGCTVAEEYADVVQGAGWVLDDKLMWTIDVCDMADGKRKK
jgi:hypothetical protein